MFEPKSLNGLSDDICISNLSECETTSEEIDRIINNMEIVENFTFFDQMEFVEN